MMKKIYLTVISLAFLLASCNKWLDINPELGTTICIRWNKDLWTY